MARIEEYNSQVETPTVSETPSVNLGLVNAPAEALQNLGNTASDIGQVIHRRTAQMETADVYSSFADQRADYTQKLQQKIQDGSLDVDNFMQDYDDHTEGQKGDYSTPEGKNFYERQQSRLRGMLYKTAMAGQSQIAARDAQGDWQNTTNKNSLTLQSDPGQFQDIMEASGESVDALIKSGGLPEKYRAKALNEAGSQYAEAALYGYAETHGADAARVMMKDGGIGKYLTVDQREKVISHIDQIERSKGIEDERTKRAVKDAQDAVAEKWGADHLQDLTNNALPTKSVLDAVKNKQLTWEQGERWLNMIKAGTKEENKGDPRVFNQLTKAITDPNSTNPITTEDLQSQVHQGKLSITQYSQLNRLMDNTPEGKANKSGEKALFDSMAKTIRFKNPMTGQYDLLGEQNLAKAKADYIHAKQNLPSGSKASDLLDPNGPMYFGNRLQQYTTSPQDQFRAQSQDRTDKALQLKPTGGNPNPTPDKGARKPGEAAADYLKRVGG